MSRPKLTDEERRERKREADRAWRAANPEKVREADRAWRAANPGKVREARRAWRATNAEKVREAKRKRYAANPEKVREAERKRYAANPEKVREADRAWRAANPEKVREADRAWRAANPEKLTARNHRRRARKKSVDGTFTAQEWIDLCNFYNNRCLCCGEQDKLTVDHVIPIICDGQNTIDNIQPLCGSCNSRKGTKIIDYRPAMKAAA
jgi:5-methylcytosine-specific restriction endonuclease McrA